MDAKPHYFRIGLFVLIALALIVLAVILFGAGLFAPDRLYIESYFAESITGLSVGAPVEFRGVRIGQVEEIGFVGSAYSLEPETPAGARFSFCVRVVVGVLRAALPEPDYPDIGAFLTRMVGQGLRVRVSSNLLTQQAYLDLDFLDPERFPVEPPPWTPRYPVIPSAPGEFTTIRGSIDNILGQLQAIDAQGLAASLERVFTALDTAITEANLAELSKEGRALLQVGREKIETLETAKINAAAQEFLAALNRAVDDANVPELSRRLSDILTLLDQKLTALDAERINAEVRRVLASLDRAVADANVPAVSGQAQALLAELRTTNRHLQRLFAPPEGVGRLPNVPEVVARFHQALGNLNALITEERPNIERTLGGLQDLVDSMRDLVNALEQDPAGLLFGRPPRRPEALK
ncbi:MAG: MCE family protein [Planctomycetes bacterium]|nr:MCE family protein [Planctomycetota bacterium]